MTGEHERGRHERMNSGYLFTVVAGVLLGMVFALDFRQALGGVAFGYLGWYFGMERR